MKIRPRPRSKQVWKIVARGHNGRKYYFTGTGFDLDNEIVMTYPDQDRAHDKMRAIHKKLPAKIELITLEHA